MSLWKKYYYPNKEICIDETVIPFHGVLKFKIYLKNKPNKFGILMYALCDSVTSYLLNAKIYGGKQENDDNKFTTSKLVMELIKDYLNKNHILFIDNFYTTIELVNDLYKNNTGCVGILRDNRVRDNTISLGMKKTDVRFFQHVNLKHLVLTVWYDSKIVKALSNCFSIKMTEKRTIYKTNNKEFLNSVRIKKLPLVFKEYNIKARGVDRANQIALIYK
jgi:hypothetical protein